MIPSNTMSESSTITQFGNTLLLGAMPTTEESPFLLKAMADNSDTTCRTDGCERMDRALEAIVCVSLSVLGYLEYFVVIVSAGFTFGHGVTAPGGSRVLNAINPMLAQQVPFVMENERAIFESDPRFRPRASSNYAPSRNAV